MCVMLLGSSRTEHTIQCVLFMVIVVIVELFENWLFTNVTHIIHECSFKLYPVQLKDHYNTLWFNFPLTYFWS